MTDSWTYEIPNVCNNIGNVASIATSTDDTNNFNWINGTVSTIVLPIDAGAVRSILAAGDEATVPTTFSWRDKTGIEAGGARNQAYCGSCFAFAVASALGDRTAIKFKLTTPPMPSAMWILANVNKSDVTLGSNSCGGGIPQLALQWVEKNCVKSESCWPYAVLSGHPTAAPNTFNFSDTCCFDCCTNPDAIKKYYVKPGSTKPLVALTADGLTVDVANTILAIKKEIMTNGPVVTAFDVYDDFERYWQALTPTNTISLRPVYKKSTNAIYKGGHAVVITGWGITPGGQQYWEIRNSWGNTGDHGYGYVAFYSNDSSNVAMDVPLPYNGGWRGGVTTFDTLNPSGNGADSGGGSVLGIPLTTLVIIIIILIVTFLILRYGLHIL